jgi:hypothetical protein
MKKSSYERQTALRKAGYKTLTTDCQSITRQPDGGWWIENTKPIWNAKDSPMGRGLTTGYYCDSFREEIYVPAVVRMGRRLFAGYLEPWSNGFRAGPDTFPASDLEWAQCAADDFTERAAEVAREHDERWQEARALEDKIEDLETERAAAYAEARGLVADIRESALSAGLCDRLRALVGRNVKRARECLREIARLREELAEYSDVVG